MSKLPILGILILMAFVISGYVASSPHEDAAAGDAAVHVDAHVSYYEQHLVNMGFAAPRAR